MPPFGGPLNSVFDSLCGTQVRMNLAFARLLPRLACHLRLPEMRCVGDPEVPPPPRRLFRARPLRWSLCLGHPVRARGSWRFPFQANPPPGPRPDLWSVGEPLNLVSDSLCDTQVRMNLALCTAAAQVRM